MTKDPLFKVFLAAVIGYAIILGCYAYANQTVDAGNETETKRAQPLT